MRALPNNYEPDAWILLKIDTKGDKPLYKVFGAWRGGYTNGDTWRYNSGIRYYEIEDDFVYFYGYTGSCYKCRLDSENCLSYYHMGVVAAWMKEHHNALTKISFEDFVKEFVP